MSRFLSIRSALVLIVLSIFKLSQAQTCEADSYAANAYADATNNNTITAALSWEVNGAVEEYQAQVNANGTSTLSTVTSDTLVLIQNLLPNTTYQWRVRTKCNGVWAAWPSWQSSFATPDGASCESDGHESNAYVDATNNNTITAALSWEVNGAVEEYQAQVNANGTSTLSTVTSDTLVLIQNLLPNTTYQWRVRTKCNGVWAAWPSWQSSFATPDGASCESDGHEANAYVDATNNNTITAALSWEVNGAVEEYQAQVNANGTSTLSTVISDTLVLIQNLLPNTTYQWRVRTKCNGVWAAWPSWQSSFATPDGASCESDGHESNAYVDATNNNTITAALSWEVNGAVEEYQAQVNANGTSTLSTVTSDTLVLIQNLLPNTTYQWRVRTKCNGVWAAWPSWQSSFATPDGASCESDGHESNAYVDATNNNTITAALSWEVNGAVEEYQAQVNANGTSTLSTVTSDTLVLIQNLLPNTTYQWRVRTKCNGVWAAWPSWQSSFATPDGASCESDGHESNAYVDATNNNTITAALSWEVNGAVEEYQAQVNANGTSTLSTVTSDTLVLIQNLLPNTTYQWRVRTKCNGVWAAWPSWQSSFATPDGASCESDGHEANAYVDATNNNTITAALSWEVNGAVEEYQAQVNANGTSTLSTVTSDTLVLIQNLLPNTTYQWRVRTKCNGLWAAWPSWQSSFATPSIDYDIPAGAIEILHEDGWSGQFTTVGATNSGISTDCGGYDRWFKFTAQNSYIKIVSSAGILRATSIGVWSLENDELVNISCKQSDLFHDYEEGDSLILNFEELVIDSTYYISFGYNDVHSSASPFELRVRANYDYDYPQGALEIPYQNGWSGNYSTVGSSESNAYLECGGYDRWFKFTALGEQVKLISSSKNPSRTHFGLWESVNGSLVNLVCNQYGSYDDPVQWDSLAIVFDNLVPESTYYISFAQQNENKVSEFKLKMNTYLDYDYPEGAIDIQHENGTVGIFTTVGGTNSGQSSTCSGISRWEGSDRWFKFIATDEKITVSSSVETPEGSSLGLWRMIDGELVNIGCEQFIGDNYSAWDILTINSNDLIPDSTYYLSFAHHDLINASSFELSMETSSGVLGYEIPIVDGWSGSFESELGNIYGDLISTCGSKNNYKWFWFEANSEFVRITSKLQETKNIGLTLWEYIIVEGDGLGDIDEYEMKVIDCHSDVMLGDSLTVSSDQLIPGNIYLVSMAIDGKSTSFFDLRISTAIDFDYLEGALLIDKNSGDEWVGTFTTIGTTPSDQNSSCGGGNDVWFEFTRGEQSATIRATPENVTGFSVSVWQYEVDPFSDSGVSLSEVACISNTDTPFFEIDPTHLVKDSTYLINIAHDQAGNASQFDLSILFQQEEDTSADSTQSNALKDLYLALDGDSWELNWPISDEFENMEEGEFYDRDEYSQWDGLTVENGKVTTLDLSGLGISGSIPSSISELDSLVIVDFSDNNITTIPDELWQLEYVTSIDISNNQISDIVGDGFGSLSNLVSIDLSGNQLGYAPDEIWQLPNIESINLSNNQISDIVGDAFGSLSSLTTLDLSYNQLIYPPDELAYIYNLTNLNLSNNQIDYLPDFGETGIAGNLNLNVRNNQLGFDDFMYLYAEEDSFIFNSFLYEGQAEIDVELYHNSESYFSEFYLPDTIFYSDGDYLSFYSLPDGEDTNSNWAIDQGSGYDIFEPDPSEEWLINTASQSDEGWYRAVVTSDFAPGIELYTKPFYLKYDVQPLIEEDRPQFEALRDLFYALDGENWEIDGWPSLATFQQLEAMDSFLDRNSYSNWQGITQLDGTVRSINLSGRSLSGQIPNSIGRLADLGSLNLSDNEISGELPDSLINLTKLVTLNLSNNQLVGELPAFTVTSDRLRTIDLSDNMMEGSLNALNPLAALEFAYLENNRFNQLSADFFDGLPELVILDLERNQFETFPAIADSENASNVQVNLDYNRLSFGSLEQFYDSNGHPFDQLRTVGQQPVFHLDSVYEYFIDDFVIIEGTIDGTYNRYKWQRNVSDRLLSDEFGELYQNWQTFKDSTNVLTIPLFTFNESDEYRLVVTNDSVAYTFISPPIYIKGRSEMEFLALKELYQATDGDNWTNNDGWPTSDEFDFMVANDSLLNVDEMEGWYGLVFDENKLVEIDLSWNNLNGELPPSIGSFKDVWGLFFLHNNLTGYIPKEIGDLPNLLALDLGSNQLYGGIPQGLAGDTLLIHLELGDNDLSIDLNSLLSMKELRTLNLSKNYILAGSFPAAIGQLTKLERLYLAECELRGPIPIEIGNLSNLQYLSLGGNNLWGSIPSEIGQLTGMLGLWLSDNRLSGPIPSEIGNLVNLRNLYLEYNDLTGSIPESIVNLTQISIMDLSYNELAGPLPSGFNYPNAIVIEIDNNQLTGQIPSFIEMNNLSRLNLSHNQFTSWDDTGLSSLSVINTFDIGRNAIAQTIPGGFLNLTNLNTVDLSNNQFSGDIPLELLQNDRINNLFLNDNLLSGFEGTPQDVTNTSVGLWISNNQFDFETLEPYFVSPGVSIFSSLNYSSQNVTYGSPAQYEASSWMAYYKIDIAHQPVPGNNNRYSLQVYEELSKFEDVNGVWIPVSYFDYADFSDQDYLDTSQPQIPAVLAFMDKARFKVSNQLVTGLELFTDEIEVTLNEDLTVVPPSSVNPFQLNSSKIRVIFDDRSTIEQGYNIYRSESEQGPYELIGFVKPIPGDLNYGQYIDDDLEPGITYHYDVSLVLSEDNEIFSSNTGSVSSKSYVTSLGNTQDRQFNWIQSISYNENGEIVGGSKSFLNAFGTTIQYQTLNPAEGDILTTKFELDDFGRVSKQFLPYPNMDYLGNLPVQFRYQNDYSVVTTPEEFHNGNWIEPLNPHTAIPYSETKYSFDHMSVLSTLPGEGYAMGSGREVRKGSFPAFISEIPNYQVLHNEILNRDDQISNLTKSVSIDPNGKYSLSFEDQRGNTIATATSGGDVSQVTLTSTYYVNVFLPISTNVSTVSPDAIQVFDESDGDQVQIGTIPANGSLSLNPGFYKFVSLGGLESVFDLSYDVDYGTVAYYFYDVAGRLVQSISPNGLDRYFAGDLTSELDKDFYQYDQSGQVISGYSSDDGTANSLYNENGLVRFTQDDEQISRGSHVFSYSDFDKLGRILELGEHVTPGVNFGSTEMDDLLDDFGYNSWPSNQKQDWTRYTYDLPDENFASQTGLSLSQSNIEGQVSSSESETTKSWYSYDQRGRLEWFVQLFKELNKIFVEEYAYDKNGLIERIAFQSFDEVEAFYHHFTYDREGKLDKILTSTTGELIDAYEHVNHSYNMDGSLKKIKYANRLQESDFVYTTQGWIKAINGVNEDPDFDGKNGTYYDVFGQIINYHSNDFITDQDWYELPLALPGIEELYGGMIKSLTWSNLSKDNLQDLESFTYAYEYDDEYQLLNSHFNSDGTFDKSENPFGEKGLLYDKNGNIQSLQRFDKDGVLSHDFDLAYQYSNGSNRLTGVNGYLDNITYDESGRATGYNFTDPGTDDLYFEYNSFSQVTALYADLDHTVKIYSYSYDDRGNRILKRNEQTGVDEWYVYDASSELIGVYYKEGANLVQGELMIGGSYGIAYRNIDHWQYNYVLTDHIGSTRAVVSNLKFMGTATMEDSRQTYENLRFENLDTRQQDMVNAIDGNYSALLNPALTGGNAIGPAKSLEVKRGDKIEMSVLVSYDAPVSDNTFLSGLSGLITNAFGGASQIGEGAASSISSAVSGDALVPTPSDSRVPKAYLQFLKFDENFNFVGAESGSCDCFDMVTSDAEGIVDTLRLTTEVEENGYVFIYVANESDNNVNVWFDNLTISQTGLNIIQQTDYYSFGSVAKNEEEQDYRFGYQGTFAEEDAETGLNNFDLRSYDPVIGRWLSVDPYGQHWSSYLGMGNTPNMSIDPDGGWSNWTTAAIGFGIGGAAGYLASDGDWGWATIGAIGGGLLGKGLFRDINYWSSKYGNTGWKTKPSFFLSAGQIDISNFIVDPLLKVDFDLAIASFNVSRFARKQINFINDSGGTIIRRSTSGNNTFNNDASITWSPNFATNFTIDFTVSHPSFLMLFHELSHSYSKLKLSASDYAEKKLDYLDKDIYKFWESPEEKYAVQNTNRLAKKFKITPRVGYGGGIPYPASDIFSTNKLSRMELYQFRIDLYNIRK